jgi:hypothetical protein
VKSLTRGTRVVVNRPAAAGALGGGGDRGVVLGAQVLDAIGVRRGPSGRGAVVVAESAPPGHGVHRRHRVDADHLGRGQTDGDGHGAGSFPERVATSARRTARNVAVRGCGVGSTPITVHAQSKPHARHVHASTSGGAG